MSIDRLNQLRMERPLSEQSQPLEMLAAAESAWQKSDHPLAIELASRASKWFSEIPALQEHDAGRLLEAAVVLACSGERQRAADLLAGLRGHTHGVIAAVTDCLLLAADGDTETAFQCLEPHYPGLRHHPEITFFLGLLDIARGAWESTLTYAGRLLEMNGDSRDGHWLSTLAHRGRKDPAKAIIHLKALSESGETPALILLAETELELENPENALLALEKISVPGSEVLIQRAWILFILGRLDESEDLLENYPGGGLRLRLQADLAVTRGHHAAAIPLYNEYLRETAGDISSRINLAQCQLLTGQPRDARETLAPLLENTSAQIPQRAHDLAWRIDSVLKIEGKLQ